MKIKLPIPQNFTEDVIAKTGDTPFLEQLEFNIEQLNYRLSVLASIDVTVKENQFPYGLRFCIGDNQSCFVRKRTEKLYNSTIP